MTGAMRRMGGVLGRNLRRKIGSMMWAAVQSGGLQLEEEGMCIISELVVPVLKGGRL